MRCSFNLCHGRVQSFLKEDTFRCTSISSVLNFHRSEDLGSYSDAFSHGFPKQWQRQPSDSALLSKGLLLSWRQCFLIFSFTAARLFLPSSWRKSVSGQAPTIKECQRAAGPGAAPGIHHSALLLQPWNLTWSLQQNLAAKHVGQDKPKTSDNVWHYISTWEESTPLSKLMLVH